MRDNSLPMQHDPAIPDEYPRWTILVLALAMILLLRLLLLSSFPPVQADEGGWPLNVRVWLTEGIKTKDYFLVPAYYWVLSVPFAIFGATLAVARAASAVLGLVGLSLFYGLALRALGERRGALWAAVILGVSYPAIMIDRRALIEPLQTVWLVAVVFFFLGRSRWDRIGLAGSMAGLLLTKVSGIFILPALMIASLFEKTNGPWAARLSRWFPLIAGAGIAIAVFVVLCFVDSTLSLKGWSQAAFASSSQGPVLVRLGRFGVDPVGVFETFRWLTGLAPFLVAFGLAGTAKGLLEGRQCAIVCWLVVGLAFLLLQLYRLENHTAPLYPALVLAATWLLMELDRQEQASTLGRLGLSWPRVVLVCIVVYSVARLVGGLVLVRDPTASAVDWLQARVGDEDRVVAAPYVLMQLRAQPVSFWDFPPDYLPTCERLAHRHINWVFIDRREWLNHLAEVGFERQGAVEALAGCGVLELQTPDAAIYRIALRQSAERPVPPASSTKLSRTQKGLLREVLGSG